MPTKKDQLRQYLERREPAGVSEAEWFELLQRFAPISESYLRKLLHDAGLRIAQPFEDVRSSSFDQLESSLVEMEKVYRAATASGDEERARLCRRAVIQAKDRARMHAKKRPEKQEMVDWMLVWLENPEVFEAWVKLRRKQMDA